MPVQLRDVPFGKLGSSWDVLACQVLHRSCVTAEGTPCRYWGNARPEPMCLCPAGLSSTLGTWAHILLYLLSYSYSVHSILGE